MVQCLRACFGTVARRHSPSPRVPVEARHAQVELTAARNFYVEHMARCLRCSRRLVAPDALLAVRERLRKAGRN